MGNCASGDNLAGDAAKNQKEERFRSEQIDAQNRKDLQADAGICKMLLLGAGESGKSTLFKQITSIYGEGFSQSQLDQYSPSIHQNVISSMKQLVQFSDNLDESFDSRVRPEAEGSKQYIQKLKSDHILLDEELSNHIRILWNDQGIRNTFAQRSKFQFMDAAEYFFDNLDRITPSDYHPTYEDVLRCRVRTTGIVESHFKLSGHQFVLIDVGGQRNERKKWIHCFEGVTAVIFVASLSEYDQLLFEDNSTNRVIESLSLFEEICGSRWFSRSPIILFLNKRDLFMKKLENTPLQQYFEDYNGGCDYNQGVKFMENLFLSRVPPKKSPDQIFVHVTCATDKDNVQHVFNDVKEIFITQNLLESGLALM